MALLLLTLLPPLRWKRLPFGAAQIRTVFSRFSEFRKRQQKSAPKKYPILLGNVSKDKSPSIQYYFAKYPCLVFQPSLPQSGEKGCGIGCSNVFVAQRSGIVQNGKSHPPGFSYRVRMPGLMNMTRAGNPRDSCPCIVLCGHHLGLRPS